MYTCKGLKKFFVNIMHCVHHQLYIQKLELVLFPHTKEQMTVVICQTVNDAIKSSVYYNC